MNKKIVFLRGFNEKPVTESGLESRFKLQCSSGNKGFVLQVIVCDCIYPLACGVLSPIHSHHSPQPRVREPSNRNIKGLASAHEICQFVIKKYSHFQAFLPKQLFRFFLCAMLQVCFNFALLCFVHSHRLLENRCGLPNGRH